MSESAAFDPATVNTAETSDEALALATAWADGRLLQHRKKLGRLCKADKRWAWQKIDKAAVLGVIALLCGGAAIGGAVALIPFYASHPNHHTKVAYFIVVGFTGALALLAGFGRMAVRGEQMTTLTDLHDEFGSIVDDYQDAMAAAKAAAADTSTVEQPLGEARS